MSRPISVLVVEDDAVLADTIAASFRSAGRDVYIAGDGASAFDLARARQPDAVLLDLGLPDTDGYDVARRLRGEILDNEAPIIVLTGQRVMEPATDDVDLFLLKPVAPEQLGDLIDFVARRRARLSVRGEP